MGFCKSGRHLPGCGMCLRKEAHRLRCRPSKNNVQWLRPDQARPGHASWEKEARGRQRPWPMVGSSEESLVQGSPLSTPPNQALSFPPAASAPPLPTQPALSRLRQAGRAQLGRAGRMTSGVLMEGASELYPPTTPPCLLHSACCEMKYGLFTAQHPLSS